MNNTNLKMFLINYQIPKEIGDFYVAAAEKYKHEFVIQPGGERRFVSLQLKKGRSYYRPEWFREMKDEMAAKIGLDKTEYVRVRDSVGVNEAGAWLPGHRDFVWKEVIDKEAGVEKNKILSDFYEEGFDTNESKCNFVQMRCNFFILEPDAGQDAWLEDKILRLPKGHGVGFDSGYIHGTTPGVSKKITLSLGFLMRKATFEQLLIDHYRDDQVVEDNPYFSTTEFEQWPGKQLKECK
jgi:hypothetical protein